MLADEVGQPPPVPPLRDSAGDPPLHRFGVDVEGRGHRHFVQPGIGESAPQCVVHRASERRELR
jgi:hypothetical protein